MKMNKTTCCRVCLADNVKLYSLLNTPLQELYENLTDAKIIPHVGKPTAICYLCYSWLRRCLSFQQAAMRSEELLSQLYLDGIPVTDSKLSLFSRPVLHTYITTAVEHVNIYNKSDKDRYIWSAKLERDGECRFDTDSVKEENGLEDRDMLQDEVLDTEIKNLDNSYESRLPSQSIEITLASRLPSTQDLEQPSYTKQKKKQYFEVDGLKRTIMQDFGVNIYPKMSQNLELTSDTDIPPNSRNLDFQSESLLPRQSNNRRLTFEYESKNFDCQNLDSGYDSRVPNLDSNFISYSSKSNDRESTKMYESTKNSQMSYNSSKFDTPISYNSRKFDTVKMSKEFKRCYSQNETKTKSDNISDLQLNLMNTQETKAYESNINICQNQELTSDQQSSSKELENDTRLTDSSPYETDSEDDVPLELLRRTPKKKTNESVMDVQKREYRKALDSCLSVIEVPLSEQLSALEARAASAQYQRAAYRCQRCYTGFPAREQYDKHMLKHHESRGAHACAVCGVRYGTARALCAHARAAHQRRYRCLRCDHVAATKSQASDHQRVHSGDLYHCQLCNKAFHARTTYLTHVRAQHPRASAACVCALCGESYVSAHGLAMHRAKTHAGGGESSLVSSAGFVCTSCGERFNSEEDLTLHRDNKHHGNMEEDNARANTKYCGSCDIHFASRLAWTRHILTTPAHMQLAAHTKECPICLQTIEGTVRSHMRIHDRETKPRTTKPTHDAKIFQCEQCPLSFANKSRLNAHTRRIHLGLKYDKDLVCETCGKHCTSAATLRYHQRTHTGERLYPCAAPACNKRFPDAYQLRAHTRTHTGERPYTCQECGRSFTQRAALNRHTRVHTGIKPHTCEICQKSFTQSNSLNTHIKSVHLKMPRKVYTKSTYVRKTTQGLLGNKRSGTLAVSDTSQLTSNVGIVDGSELSEVTLVDSQVESKIHLGHS